MGQGQTKEELETTGTHWNKMSNEVRREKMKVMQTMFVEEKLFANAYDMNMIAYDGVTMGTTQTNKLVIKSIFSMAQIKKLEEYKKKIAPAFDGLNGSKESIEVSLDVRMLPGDEFPKKTEGLKNLENEDVTLEI
jgi:hypothetical protein